MKTIIELLEQNYTLGWKPCNKLHIIDNYCCPLSMYLLELQVITKESTWLDTIIRGNGIFDKEELEGFIHGFDGIPAKFHNYVDITKYSLGYTIGKKALTKFFSHSSPE